MKKLVILFGVFLIVSCVETKPKSKNFDVEKFNIKYEQIDIQSLIKNVKDSAKNNSGFTIIETVSFFEATYKQGDSIFFLYIDDTKIKQRFTYHGRDISFTNREDSVDKFYSFPLWSKFISE